MLVKPPQVFRKLCFPLHFVQQHCIFKALQYLCLASPAFLLFRPPSGHFVGNSPKEKRHPLHQLSLGLSIPTPAFKTASLFSAKSHRLHLGSLQPSTLFSKTGHSYLFLFQFYDFFFLKRATGEGNNRAGLNICFHLMSFALALRACSGEKSLQDLIYSAAVEKVLRDGEEDE